VYVGREGAGDFAFCPFISHFVRSFRVLSLSGVAEEWVASPYVPIQESVLNGRLV